jgi:hypothetical protein
MNAPISLAFTALGVVTFGVLSFYIGQLPTAIISPPDATIIQNVLASSCASFVFLLTLNTGYYVRDAFHRRSFRAFFGDLSVSTTARFVYPDFDLSAQCRELLKNMPSTEIYQKKANQYSGRRFIDVPQIVASNDLQGIVIIATRMGRYLGDTPLLITDGQAVADPSKSLISFGLTSNAVTELYLNTDPAPLFRIADVGGEPQIVVQVNGKTERYGRTAEYQHGIILRYRPNPDDYPTTFWIICAGLAAAGTPAAAWNLAHKWPRYHRRFGKKDFLIIFATSNDVHSYTMSTEVAAISR